MDLTTVRELYKRPEEYLDEEINVGGRACSLRDSKTFSFIVTNDGSFLETLQTIYHDTLPNSAEVSKLSVGIAILVKGTLIGTPQVKQPPETQTAEVTVEGTSSPDYPLQKKRHSPEYLCIISRLYARTSTFQAIFCVCSLVAHAIHQYFREKDFTYVHTPLITGNDREGAGEMFQVTTMDLNSIPKTEEGKVDFSQDPFGKAIDLTVNGQLNAETYAIASRNIYTFGPTLHAENSSTIRHAAEFRTIKPEIASADLDDSICLVEGMSKYIICFILEHASEEMNFSNQLVGKDPLDRLHNVLSSEFGRVTYIEAIKILEEHNNEFDHKVSWGCDLRTEHECYLTEQVFRKPVFVTDYPKEIKAFCMKMNPDNKTVTAVDCLVPGIGKIVGGSQRGGDYGRLVVRMDELGLKKGDYDSYLDLRKYRSMRYIGFGLGFERCVMYLTGMPNIRDIISSPRTMNNYGL